MFWTFLIQNKLFKSFSCEFFYLNCLKSCGKIWLTHRIFFPVSWKNFPKNHWEFIKTESENSKKICPTHRKRFFLWVGQIFPVSWTNFFRVLTLSFYWSCKQLFQLSCPSGLLLAIITYCYDSLKFLEKSRKFEKAFCWCYCSGFTLFGENLPRVILIFPSYLGWKKGIS